MLFAALCLCFGAARAGGPPVTHVDVVVVYGPGHSAVHLERGGRHLYWDPGGSYGEQRIRCRNQGSTAAALGACQHYDGYDWDALEGGRENDVFSGRVAELMHVLSLYHLEGSYRSLVFGFDLDGETGERAWQLIDRGRAQGPAAPFKTDRPPFFCVKAVTEYLHELGGRFADLPSPWRPGQLEDALRDLGLVPSGPYTPRSAAIRAYIESIHRGGR